MDRPKATRPPVNTSTMAGAITVEDMEDAVDIVITDVTNRNRQEIPRKRKATHPKVPVENAEERAVVVRVAEKAAVKVGKPVAKRAERVAENLAVNLAENPAVNAEDAEVEDAAKKTRNAARRKNRNNA